MTTSSIGASRVRMAPPPPPPSGARRTDGAQAMPDPSRLLQGQSVDGLDLSDPAQLFSSLQDLQDKDPDQLKQVLSDIADKLRAVASGGTTSDDGTTDATTDAASAATAGNAFLTKLADRFDAAAESGDLSTLVPPAPPSGARGGSRAESAYRAAEQSGRGSLASFMGAGSSDTSSSSDVSQQIAELRREIAALVSQQSKQTASA